MNAPTTFHPVESPSLREYDGRVVMITALLRASVRELREGQPVLAEQHRNDARTLFDGLGVLVLEMQQQENPDDELVCAECGEIFCDVKHEEEP